MGEESNSSKEQSQHHNEHERSRSLFLLGQIVGTSRAIEALDEADETADQFLLRHVTGDWGNLCAEDMEANRQALIHNDRIFSAYKLSTETRIWIITEWDRSYTTLLLPDEY